MGSFCRFTPSQNTDTIWKFFAPIIGNNFGTAGLVAGLYMRSGGDPFFGYDRYSGFNPLELKNYAYDKHGFGIGRWRHWTRKQSLYNFCKKAGVPLYKLYTQMEFVMDEFSGTTYGPVLKELKDATSVKDAACLIYDRYLDINNRNDEKRELCAMLAMDIYNTYGAPIELMEPVKYVKTDRKRVRVKGERKRRFPFLRKKLGYLKPGEQYRFIAVSHDGKEYALYFEDRYGFVDAEKSQIITHMEAIK